jgi:hypothetical protein
MPLRRRLAPYFIACAIAALFFTTIELARPYYFFQDDNRDIFIPLYLHNYRAAADGQLAQYNFYQSLGRPHYASGQVAALHPIPYISIFLSYALFGHVFAAADILTLLYLLIGVLGAVFLIRLLGFSDWAAVFAAVSWTITPFNMLVSQSWTTYPPVIGTLPWIIASALLIYRRRYATGGWLFALSHLTLIYVGAPQFVLYAAGLEAGLILVLVMLDARARLLDARAALRTLGVYSLLVVVVAGLSMPLLYPMWRHTQQSAFRRGQLSDPQLRVCSVGPVQLLNGIAVPFSRFYLGEGNEWCGTNFPASFTHQGYLVTLLVLAYPWLRRRVSAEQRRVLDASLIVAVVFFLAMMGYLTHIISVIPVANRFRWPFKYFGFANLLFVLCAAAGFDVWLARLNRRAVGIAVIALQSLNLTALDLTFPTQAFFEHADPVPLHEPLRARLDAGRILSIGWRGAAKAYTAPTLGYDYATLWELHYFGGYDPLVPSRNLRFTYALDYFAILNTRPEMIRIDYLRFWGVRWYVLNEPWANLYEPYLVAHGLRRVYSDERRVLLEDPRAEPLVGSADCVTRSIGRDGDDLVARLDCARATNVRLRFLDQPDFLATIDGKSAEIKPLVSDQMSLAVPAGSHEVRIDYDDPTIEAGLWIAALTAASAALAFILWRNLRRKPPAKDAA